MQLVAQPSACPPLHSPANMLRPYEEPWYFYGRPLQLSSLELPGLDETHAPRYNEILQLPSIISRSSDNVLQILWEFPEDDLNDALVKKFILASVGVGGSQEAQAQAEQIYDEVRTHLFGPCGVIRGTTVLSCFQRILRHQIVRDTEIHDFRALGIQNASLPLDQPDFIFHAKLVPRDGYEPIESLSRYYSWFTWIYPRQGIGFAFAEGNWCTLGAFREVVDALLGRHVAAGPPAAPISIFTDPGCTVVALDESPLSGDFYFQLTTTVLGDTPLFSDEPVLPKEDFCFSQYSDLPRRETFANRVDYRCAHKCALSKAAELGEPDTEAAYIIPRCAHKAFPRLLQKILPSTNVQSIDHPANGINLWLAVHRAWDGHRAALSPSPRNVCTQATHIIHLFTCETDSSPDRHLFRAPVSLGSVTARISLAVRSRVHKIRFCAHSVAPTPVYPYHDRMVRGAGPTIATRRSRAKGFLRGGFFRYYDPYSVHGAQKSL
ncbi:hypothetical protein B0H11DRAFT_471605 [Mycena galericulata]|nr:hypothetical protein B0H11DRAFT_471605 [Mycena galericulata]